MKLSGTLLILCLTPAAALAQTTWYVPDDFPSGIQSAISDPLVVDYDTIVIKPGTYVENIDFLGKAITIKSEQGPEVTIIDGGQAGPVVSFVSGEGLDSVLEGFTLTNGSGAYYAIFDEFNGGGVLCDHSSPMITGNIITGNEVRDIGAGMFCYVSSVVVTDNVISNNVALQSGGGIYSYNASPTITGNEFSLNTSGRYGGGLRSRVSDIILTDNVFSENSAVGEGGAISYASKTSGPIARNIITGNTTGGDGGGIFCERSSPSIETNVIIGNTADKDGGGIFCNIIDNLIFNNILYGNVGGEEGGGLVLAHGNSVVTNNTICGNSSETGGGIYSYNATITVTNTIFWDNTALTADEIWVGAAPSELTISHSVIQGGSAGVVVESGSTLIMGAMLLDMDPMLKDCAAGDFNLTYGSPCINAGDNNAVPQSPEDIGGDPRIAGGVVDMGADEYYYHLYMLGDPIPGNNVDFRIVSLPGKPVLLLLGFGIQDPPIPLTYGDLYLPLPISSVYNLGVTPSDGIVIWNVQIPPPLQSGAEFYFQALVGAVGNPESRLTNLLIMVVE